MESCQDRTFGLLFMEKACWKSVGDQLVFVCVIEQHRNPTKLPKIQNARETPRDHRTISATKQLHLSIPATMRKIESSLDSTQNVMFFKLLDLDTDDSLREWVMATLSTN